jgi:predicted nucleotidyltransferase
VASRKRAWGFNTEKITLNLEQDRSLYRESLDLALKEVTSFLADKPEVERIVLFGSYAAGRRDLFTDLDLLVVMSSDLDFVSRTAQVYSQIAVGVDLDLLVYTPQGIRGAAA